jgi:hypothetical protein
VVGCCRKARHRRLKYCRGCSTFSGVKMEEGAAVASTATAAAAATAATAAAPAAAGAQAKREPGPAPSAPPIVPPGPPPEELHVGCTYCSKVDGEDWLPDPKDTIRLHFNGHGELQDDISIESARELFAHLKGLSPAEAARVLAADVGMMRGYLRCRRAPRAPDEAKYRAKDMLRQEGLAEEAHRLHPQGWGTLLATDPVMVEQLLALGTHKLVPAGANDGVGFGRLLLVPTYKAEEEARGKAVTYDPSFHPVLTPYRVLEDVFGKEVADRCKPMLQSINYQHRNIQSHVDDPLDGDGHGCVIVTLCLRESATIVLHSLASHITYSFRVAPGDMWGMRGPIIFNASADGECMWEHGVRLDKPLPRSHSVDCRRCRISVNYRYSEEGSNLRALVRQRLAAAIAKAEEEAAEGKGGADAAAAAKAADEMAEAAGAAKQGALAAAEAAAAAAAGALVAPAEGGGGKKGGGVAMPKTMQEARLRVLVDAAEAAGEAEQAAMEAAAAARATREALEKAAAVLAKPDQRSRGKGEGGGRRDRASNGMGGSDAKRRRLERL